MDDDPHNSLITHQPEPESEPRSPRFLGCFGCSGKPKKPAHSKKNKKKKQWPWSRLAGKKSAAKTVPIDSTVSEITQTTKGHGSKSKPKGKPDKRSSSKDTNTTPHQIPAASEILPPPEYQASIEIADQETTEGCTDKEKIIVENGKHTEYQVKSQKVDTCQNPLSFRQKIEAIRNGISRPNSPDIRPKSNRTAGSSETKLKSNRTGSIMQTLSFAVTNHQAKQTAAGQKKESDHQHQGVGKKIEPVIGMSIVLVTLVIMLIWGRLCAILCTSAWFYFIPSLINGVYEEQNAKNGSEPDVNSDEYKKRVVLEGLLERNHRSTCEFCP